MRRKQEMAEAIRELEIEKSNLILEAAVLRGTGQLDEAIEHYALVAPMEERIAAFYEKQGDPAMAARSWFSAATCYGKSGSLRDALRVLEKMTKNKETPGTYKGEILVMMGYLRQQQREVLQAYRQPQQSAA